MGRADLLDGDDGAWFVSHPAVRGEGGRPLGDSVRLRLDLVGIESPDSGVVLLHHRP